MHHDPRTNPNLTLETADRIEEACTVFESEWHDGKRPAIEDRLIGRSGLEHSALLRELLAVELEYRQLAGERPARAEYVHRFPGDREIVSLTFQEAEAPADPDKTNAAGAASPLRDPPVNNQVIDLASAGRLMSGGDVRPLLRSRLRLIFIVSSVTSVLFMPAVWPLFDGPWSIACLLAMLVGLCAMAIVLSTQLPLSLSVLRRIEVCYFGSQVLYFAWQQLQFFQSDWLATLSSRGLMGTIIAARCQSWLWVVMIIAYGILIPNTMRRCIVAVALMASACLAVILVLSFAMPAAPRSVQAIYLSCFAGDLGIAAAFSIFGAHRIETLRREASATQKLGPYRLSKRLGGGGMGEVYLAEHELLRRPCALKLIRHEHSRDPRFLSRFEREVQTLATLTHPNTVRVYDYGLTADGTFYYAMEYLPGLSLQELVTQHGPLPPERVVYFLRQVCAALSEAHLAGLVHRDIKPANILACQIGGVHDVAKLLDFGLVRVHTPDKNGESLSGAGMITGTPGFMSPEQASAAEDVDARSDVYSLGAVAYFLLSGRPPFVHSTAVETMAAHISEPVARLRPASPGIPVDLEDVVLRCLQKNPRDRFLDTMAVDAALANCVDSEIWSAVRAADWWKMKKPDFLMPR